MRIHVRLAVSLLLLGAGAIAPGAAVANKAKTVATGMFGQRTLDPFARIKKSDRLKIVHTALKLTDSRKEATITKEWLEGHTRRVSGVENLYKGDKTGRAQEYYYFDKEKGVIHVIPLTALRIARASEMGTKHLFFE